MKKNLMVQYAGVVCLFAGLTWGGTVAVTPAAKTYLQTELTVGTPVSLPITLSGWGDTNLTVSAAGGGSIFDNVSAEPAGGTQETARVLSLTPRGVAGSTTVTVTAIGGGSASNTVSLTVTPVPVVTGLPATVSFNEDTTLTNAFVVEYWGSVTGLTFNALIETSPALIQSATISGNGTNQTLTLSPYENAYGSATVRVVTADSVFAKTNSILVRVLPVADGITVSDWPTAPIRLNVGGMPTNRVFSAVTITDPDHLAYKNGTSNEYLKASADVNNVSIHFSGGQGSATTSLTTGSTPSNVTTWVRSLSLYPPESSYAPVGQVITNTLTLIVYGDGHNDMLSVTKTVPVLLLNPNHPPQYIPSVSPSSLQEGQTISPFSLSQLFDQDATHTTFSLRLFVKPEHAALATLNSTATLYGNESDLNSQLNTMGFTAVNGGISTVTTNVTVYYVLSDSIDYVTNSVTLTINAITTAPVINGIDELSSYYSINDTETLCPFPTVIPYDTDQGGQQRLSASFSVSDPTLGGFTYQEDPVLNFSLRSQADLQAALRQLKFVPIVGALPIGTSAEVRLTLTVTDSTGLSTVNSSTRIQITAVNQPPSIKVPQEQPVLLPPNSDLRPFAGTTVTNDDLNSVTMTITLDNNAKGTLGNLGGFAYASGTYTMSGSIGAINDSLTNLTYAVNPQYLFPSDDPGGTVFTLEAEDYQIKLGRAQVWVQIQDAPRNHLVTKTVNDGTPGSLLFALAHAANNDVITFALPQYPAVIRVPEAFGPLVLSTSMTLKGPGPDLLTISGDSDGDGDADGQIFVVQSRVTIEGLTLSQGYATLGGAVSVTETGTLTLRSCAVTDCAADEYGGAIDVEGALRLENCYLARNRVSETGGGGGAVSFYTSHDSAIVNTTFASNRIDNASGAGGGAVNVERADGTIALVNVAVTHCTFAGNADASGRASAVYVVGGNTLATLKNNIFSDYSVLDGVRNIDVTGNGDIVSEGGNVCDDSTRTVFQQGGGTSVFLLTHTGDRTEVTPGLGVLTQAKGDVTPSFPLQAVSPALRLAQASEATTDQRGRIRRSQPGDSGSIQQDADERVVITEIQFSAEAGDTDQFIEVFVPRDGQDVDLSGFKLFVNGVAVHEFGQGVLVFTNNVNTTFAPASGIPASYLLAPGRGVVVAFPKGETADFTGFASLNPTPVVRASIVTNAAELALLLSSYGRGSVALAKSETAAPIVLQTFLTVFNDPDAESGTNRLDTAHNSIVPAPQSRGYAFIPHSSVSALIYGGWKGLPSVTPSGVLLQSPGATVDGTPFGLNNAFPQAAGDVVSLSEDDVGAFDVLGNDLDADGNDRLVIVDVSTASQPAIGEVATAWSQLGATVTMTPASVPLQGAAFSYDPRGSAALQALPVGVEVLDTFYYEIIDIGSAAVDAIAAGTPSNTWVTAWNHRLNTGDSVVLFGVSAAAYNGEFEVTVLDENTFAIPVPFGSVVEEPGVWETVNPRTPSERSEASVTIRVTGVNDAPTVGRDVVTNVTEASKVRIMVRPEFANMSLSLPSDPVPPPTPNRAHLLDNDSDVDTDETWQSLRLIGVMASVHTIDSYSGTPGEAPLTVHAPSHGLVSGTEILIANYGGNPSYNGYHTVTVLDPDTFTLPIFFVDNHAAKGVWVVLDESNRYNVVTDKGATVDLTLRADPREDNIIYDAATSAFLNTLAQGELYTNRFYQAVVDSHGAIGIGPIDIVVVGLNDTPVARPDPDGLSVLTPLVTPSNTLEQVLSSGLDILYTLPPASNTPGRIDVQALDLSGTLSGTLVLSNLWSTDEDTLIAIHTNSVLANDSDIDTIDVLEVIAVEATSREGASLALVGGEIRYNPTASAALQKRARDERVIDTFSITVSDRMTGGTVTSLVAVLVVGLNDTPVARPDALTLSEDEQVSFNPITHPTATPALHDSDLDMNGTMPDDLLTVLTVSNLLTTGEARVDLESLLATYDATVSERLNQLADWQEYTDSFNYTISDNSFLFVMDDSFYVPAETLGRNLDVLANDRDFTPFASTLTIVDVGPALWGGTVTIAPDGQSLVYDSPAGPACDDYFRYVVENEVGNRRSARVLVRSVTPPLNGILGTASDHAAVAYGETAVLNVSANDNTLPLSGTELSLLTNIWSSSVSGQPLKSGNVFLFTATNGMTPLTFTYGVTAGGTSVAHADVRVEVIDRRGTLYVKNDTFSVQPGSVSNVLQVLSNDNLVTGSTDALRIATLLDPALFGTATVNPSARTLVYTPNADFIGVENLRYLATDTIGGTGTGVVTIVVGKIDTVIDFFTVEAKTNDLGIALDVLANDRVQPFGTNALTLVSVMPASTGIGFLSVSGSGKHLLFTPSNTVGQADFVYVVADSTARMATGSVTIATVPSGSYANTDRFLVRGGGSAYTLDVLANDRSYPEAGKSYTLVSIGTGAEAPSAGGTVSVVSNRLSYTPLPGFVGQESFSYTMSDSVATDSAWVTVTVTQGDLFANADSFDIFYARESGAPSARAFTLPVTFNDRIQPALGQSVQITGLGVGANAPDHAGRVTISSDGLSLLYEPTGVPSPTYIERFTYEISDGAERRASGQVEVRVLNRANTLGVLVQDDAFTVLRNSTNNTMPLLSNDFAQPGTASGWVITTNSPTDYNGTVSISGANVLYTPPVGFVGIDTFTYSVNDGLGGTGSATVRVQVGALPTLPDLFVALSGSQSNDFDVVANDVLFTTYAGEYTLADVVGATHGGTVMRSPWNTVLYAPSSTYSNLYPYTESFSYTVRDDAGGVVTGVVQVVVHKAGSDQSTTTVTMRVLGRNDIPVLLNTPPNPTITDKETSHPFTGVTLIEVDQQTLELLDVTVSLDDAAKGVLRELGSFVDLGNGRYGLVGATAAAATTNLHNLLFVPTENRITVPQTEALRFTLVVTDNKSAPLADTQTVVRVTSVNDAPVIAGTRAGQTVYAAMPIRLFSSVTITDVDNLTLQPLTVTVQLSNAANGVLQNLSSFISLGGGAYRTTGLTAAQVTQQLRALEFLYGAGRVTANEPQLTVFTLTVEDAFAPPVTDNQTSVGAYSPAEGSLLPNESVLRSTFGFSVDVCQNFAVGGAPGANANGTDSGSALVYRLVPGTTNTWEQWRQLQPPGVEGNDQFGYAVSISDNLIAVGAIDDEVGTASVGVVYLFGRDVGGTDNWGLLRRLAPTNLPTGSRFGMSVDVSGDLLAVGAPKATLSGSSPAEGAVLLFGRNVNGPDAWGEIMRWEPRGQTSIECGSSVALDGDRLVTGAPRNKTGTPVSSPKGAVFCFGRDTGGAGAWGLSQAIRLGAVTNVDNFGYSVSVKGTLLAVGAPTALVPGGAISAAGVVYVFAPGEGGAWAQAARLDAAADGEVRYGQSVSLSSDLLLIGAPGSWATPVRGSAYLYRRTATDGSAWLLAERLMNPLSETSAHFANAVGLCQTVAIVGAVDGIYDRYTPNDRAYMYRFKFNNAPVAVTPLADQIAEWGDPFAYTIPDGAFADPDIYDVLTVVPVLPTVGHGLTVAGLTVSGTPTVLGRVPVEVTATDASAASTLESFDVVVLVDGILLQNTPRNLWNLLHFGKNAVNPALEATLWGGAANMDGDTKDNDTEYAFGGVPTVADASARLTLAAAPGGNLLLTYVRRKDDPALSYMLQGSPTLAPPAWDDVVTFVIGEQRTTLGTSYERVEVTISTPLAGSSMFFRVLVTP